MSFLSVLKSIGHVFQVGTAIVAPIEPIIAAIPGVGQVFNTVFSAIVGIEQLIGTPGTGAQKKQIVTQVVNTVHSGIDPAVLSNAIDALVSALNAIQAAGVKLPGALAPTQ
jgi:hypothetical protein